MATQRIGFEQLSQLSGLDSPTEVAAWLRCEGVSFSLDGQGQPWTTGSAIERALLRRAKQGRYQHSDFALEF